MNRKYAAWIVHVAHHRISLLLGEFSGFSFEAQYAVAYAAKFPDGSSRLLESTINFRLRNKVLASALVHDSKNAIAAHHSSPVADALGRTCQ